MSAVLLLSLLACRDKFDDTGISDTAPAVDVLTEVTTPGPWSVGWRSETIRYADPATGGAERELYLAVWYPTADTDGEDALYRGSIPAEGIWQDAALAPGDWPVAVFSHGHQGFAENSSFLMAFLASHGVVVAAPDHTDNTLLDGGDRATEIYAQRPGDVSAVLDHLGAEVALGLGHSFGGYTLHALAGAPYDTAVVDGCLKAPTEDGFCASMTTALADQFAAGFADPRLVAHVSMAPGDFRLFGAAGLSAVRAPVLHMTGTEDDATGGDAADIWAALQASGQGALRVDIAGAGHQSFTDFADRLEDVTLDREEGWRITEAYTLAWLRTHLDGQTDRYAPILSGEISVSPVVSLDY